LRIIFEELKLRKLFRSVRNYFFGVADFLAELVGHETINIQAGLSKSGNFL
jgi:hypothetical protein